MELDRDDSPVHREVPDQRVIVQERELLLPGRCQGDQPPDGFQAITLVRVGNVAGGFDLLASISRRKAEQSLEDTRRLNAPRGDTADRPGVRFGPDSPCFFEQPVGASLDAADLLRSDMLPVRAEDARRLGRVGADKFHLRVVDTDESRVPAHP